MNDHTNVFRVTARAHGRIVVRDAPFDGQRSRLLVAFHGYAQRAESMLEALEGVPGIERWTVASVQALHPFYGRNDQIVASWMTREDRELAIADNIDYVDNAVVALQRERRADVIVCVGFSQGAAMAWRAAVCGRRRADGVVSLGGDVPPDVAGKPVEQFPIALVAGGTRDEWYTEQKMQADLDMLEAKGAPYGSFRFDGGHEWTDDFRRELGRFLSALAG